MINEGAEYALKVAAVDEQEPVEALSASGADEAFRDRVGLRRTDRCLDDLDALACEDGVEVAGELAVAVADQEGAASATPRRSKMVGASELVSLSPPALMIGW
jgi:hypothetical protein